MVTETLIDMAIRETIPISKGRRTIRELKYYAEISRDRTRTLAQQSLMKMYSNPDLTGASRRYFSVKLKGKTSKNLTLAEFASMEEERSMDIGW